MFHQWGWKRTRAAVAKSRTRKGRPQRSHGLPLIHPQCATRTHRRAHTCAHLHTRPHARQHPLGCPGGPFIQRPPSHILAQLQTPLSASIFGLCLLFAFSHPREGSFVGKENGRTQKLWRRQYLLHSQDLLLPSLGGKRHGRNSQVCKTERKAPVKESLEEERNPPLNRAREGNCSLTF